MIPLALPLEGPLKQLGIELSPRALVVAQVGALVVPALVLGGGLAYVWWKSRKNAPPPSALGAEGASSVAGSQINPRQLAQAWRRFLRSLPPGYERSILSFEHFVVLGDAGSGKSALVNLYTDWATEMMARPGTSQPNDPDLPVYLTPDRVITELPVRYLKEHSARSQKALRALWEPLYARRSPVVVVVVDGEQLQKATPEASQYLAESLRTKINILSAVRGQPVEVRVAVTHLDAFPGFREFASFCEAERVPTRVEVTFGEGARPPVAQLESWLDSLRGYLPQALTHVPSDDFLRLVSFLRSAPAFAPGLGKFLGTLFAREALARAPTRCGVYLSWDKVKLSNPFAHTVAPVVGPDPRRRDLILAVALTSALSAYLLLSYRDQQALHAPAHAAAASYEARALGTDSERLKRKEIGDFTARKLDWMDTHPDYFGPARVKLRKQFSDKVREDLLIPRLKIVAQQGTAGDSTLSLPTRRSLYFLALIHSDRTDAFHILDGGRLEIWSRMTGLPQDLIRDYLQNTDAAWKLPVTFELSDSDADLRLNWQIWTQFLRDLDDAIVSGVIRPEALRDFQARAARLATAIERYDQDPLTASIVDQLDAAAGTEGGRQGLLPPLKQAYQLKYADFVLGAESYKIYENRDKLKSIIRTVRVGAVDAQGQFLLRTLIERLGALYEGGNAADDEPLKITMARQDHVFDPKRWRGLLRDSNGRELIVQFVRAAGTAPSIFFGPEQDAELRPIIWNPTNDGSAIFTGKGEIEARFTKLAYDNHVRAVVLKLSEALERASVPEEQKRQLADFVRDRVKRYAAEYRSQSVAFVHSYNLRTPSQEALRVALVQMARPDASAFNDFLTAIDQNTRLEIGHPLLEPMRDAVSDFAAWHNVVGGETGAPEINKYRAILSQMLADLGPPEGAAPVAEAQGPETLEKALTPAGRLVLTEVRGDKGSYAQMVSEWLLSVRLPDYQRHAFLGPSTELTRLGRRDIERVVSVAWENEILPEVRRISGRYPFDPSATEDVTPGELTALFHPLTGRYFDLFRRYFEPLSDFGDGGPFRAKPSVRGRITLPPHLHELTNGVAALSARLWDQTGKPVPLAVRVATVPFEHGRSPKLAQTLVYLNAGPASLFNFNQQPAEIPVMLDWTKEYNSQVGLQLTDVETKENVFPEPTAVAGSFWSFLRLLQKGRADAVKFPLGAQLYTWPIKIGREGVDTMPVQFVVLDDLFAAFSLGGFVRLRLGAAPVAQVR